jgi:hypothetical protein
VGTHELLVGWLGERSPEELARIIDARPLLLRYGQPPVSLDDLARQLKADHNVNSSLDGIDQPEFEVLAAAAGLAMPQEEGSGYGRYLEEYLVSRDELLSRLGEQHQDAGRAVIRRLSERLLLFPAPEGWLALPAGVVSALGRGEHRPRSVDRALSMAYNKPEILEIAGALGFTEAGSRAEAQQRIVELLADPGLVRTLVATAPDEARDLLVHVVAEGGPFHTTAFGLAFGGRYVFKEADPGAAWLAGHGLIIPLGPGVAEVPREVVEALTVTAVEPFTPEPPRPPSVDVPEGRVDDEARAAVSAAAGRLELLLKTLAVAPASVRKSGGLAVRETKRIARAIGADETETRFWIDITLAAGLLGIEESNIPATRSRRVVPRGDLHLLPSRAYDAWLDLPPAARLAPIVAAWAHYRNIVTWWPEGGETPVALVAPQDFAAPILRMAVLRVLATLPDGQGYDLTNPSVLDEVLDAVAWHRPVAVDEEADERMPATLREAALLGVVAHGALTALGQSVWVMLESPQPYDEHGDPLPQDGAALVEPLTELLPDLLSRGHFQADLTVIVPGIPSAALTALLNSVADRESEGHAVVWRFSADSVRRALDAGLGADELLEDLRNAATGPLPQPLEYMIKDTARRHGTVRVVRSACCLRSDDEALIHEISQHRSLRKLGLRRIAPTVVISARPVQATLEALREAGYAPVTEAETGETVVERIPDRRAPAPRCRPDRNTLTGLELARRLLSPGA